MGSQREPNDDRVNSGTVIHADSVATNAEGPGLEIPTSNPHLASCQNSEHEPSIPLATVGGTDKNSDGHPGYAPLARMAIDEVVNEFGPCDERIARLGFLETGPEAQKELQGLATMPMSSLRSMKSICEETVRHTEPGQNFQTSLTDEWYDSESDWSDDMWHEDKQIAIKLGTIKNDTEFKCRHSGPMNTDEALKKLMSKMRRNLRKQQNIPTEQGAPILYIKPFQETLFQEIHILDDQSQCLFTDFDAYTDRATMHIQQEMKEKARRTKQLLPRLKELRLVLCYEPGVRKTYDVRR